MDLKQGLQLFGCLAVLLSLLPLVAADYWWIRMFDFPHLQFTALTLLALLAFFWKFELREPRDYAFVAILAGCLAFQVSRVYPFTPLADMEMLADQAKTNPGIRVVAANVLQSNKKDSLLAGQIKAYNPDLLLLTEANARWQDALAPVTGRQFPYKKEIPLENTYGMLLYSKFPLIEPEVRFMVDDSIPSIHSRIKLPSGDTLQLHCIHPTPPMPQHNPMSTDRDAELMRTARMSRQSDYPVLVLGDFNDVAWSESTGLFQRVGRLLDPRKGRGFFNTYHAQNWVLRWPLDHFFANKEFRLKDLEVMPDIGSDHFPVFIHLAYFPEGAGDQSPEPASEEDLKTASYIIGQEIRQDSGEGNDDGGGKPNGDG